MTLPEFLAWEERQELRHEFDGFQPVAMTGGTVAHNRIMRRLHRALERRLAGKSCESFGPDVKMLTPGKARYSDALVTCTPQAANAQVIENPVVVFEILSAGNSRTDRIEKVQEHKATSSIQRCVILEQTSIGAMVFERRADEWAAFTLTEGGTLHMPEIKAEIPLAEIYADIAFPPDGGQPPGDA